MLTPALATIVAFGVGAVAYLWAERLGPKGRLLTALRGTAGTLLALLLLDLTCARSEAARRPLVLLDGSLSMSGAGGRGTEAADSARAWGEIRYFGQDPTGPDSAPGFGRSSLLPALLAASALDRPLIVVTDGAIDDRRDLPADLLARADVRPFPRAAIADVAVLRLEAAERVTLGDTLRIDVDLGRYGGAANAVTVELLARGAVPILSRPVTLGPGGGGATLQLPTRALGAGDHLLTVRVRSAGDAEARDDARQLLVRVTPLPGVVLLAAPPDWDARQLYATLRDVAALPVKGYVRLGSTGWRAIEGGRRVSVEEVTRAARGADLLVLKGDPGEVVRGARPRGLWRWPSGEGGETQLEGDWYVGEETGSSPLSALWNGVAVDSLPPLARVTPIEPGPSDWTGLTAQLGRRGAERAILIGRDSAGIRILHTAADGFWRWAFRPGEGEDAYRQLVAASANWLMGAADTAQGVARPVRRVVALGRPVTFQWSATGVTRSTSITFTGDSGVRVDTLRFDGSGMAEMRLPPGRYLYQVEGGGRGEVAVEAWSSEYVPQASSLVPQASAGIAGLSRTALRDKSWVYLVVVILLCGEWWLRRRMGLR